MDLQRKNYYLIDDNDGYIAFNCDTLGIYRIGKENIDKALDEIDSKFNEKTLESSEVQEIAKKLKTLVICASEECNLACEYCFANKGNYHNNKKQRIIDFEEYKQLFLKIYTEFPEGMDTINFFGGEPMLGYPHIKKAIEWLEEYCKENKLSVPVFSIISNGTIMSKEIFEFLNAHNVYLTISLDADERIHDMFRKYKNGAGSYEKVRKNLEMIKHFLNRKFLLTSESTIGWNFLKDYESGKMGEYFSGFYELGIDSVVTFIVDSDAEVTKEMEEKIKVFYTDLIDYTFDLIIDCKEYRNIPPFILDQIVNIITKRRKRECRVGKTTLFYTSGGELFPCQMFYQANKNSLGNLFTDDIRNNMKNLKKVSRTEIDECASCIAKNTCQEWCEGSSTLMNRTGKSVIKTRCILQKTITRQIIKNLSALNSAPEKRRTFIKNMKYISQKFSYQTLINSTIF